MSEVKMPQKDWSDFATGTGPDPRQPDMVSRGKVLNHLWRLESLAILNGDQATILALRDAIRKVESL